MLELRDGSTVEDPRLGRIPAPDWDHYDKYPLRALPVRPRGVPVVFGVNWYSNFDTPQKDGTRYWIGRGDLGHVRGGHCVAGLPTGFKDPLRWWDWYNQGTEGACVGEGCSRAMSLLNRRRYDPFWLYHMAQTVDEWPGEGNSGTSVRAGFDILLNHGHVPIRGGKAQPPDPAQGISAYRWLSTWEEVRFTLGVPDGQDGVPFLNSWGRNYPHVTRITDEAGSRVLAESGEVGAITDR